MAPERIAVVTILICIGILLLSACGLPIGPSLPSVRPMVVYGDFYVYTRGANPEMVAYGDLGGTSNLDHIPAHLTFVEPSCLAHQQFSLSGPVSSGLNGDPLFASVSRTGTQIQLASIEGVNPYRTPLALDLLPFTGLLTVSRSCADVSNLAVEVRRVPGLAGSPPP